jgi:hypothetical protein
VVSSVVGGDQGSSLSTHYGYLLPRSASGVPVTGVRGLLVGFATHPVEVARQVWGGREALWAYASSSGLLGLCTPLSVLPVVVLLESGAGQGASIRSVAYENFGALLFAAPLSVLALAWIADRLAGARMALVCDRTGLRWLTAPVLPTVAALLMVCNSLAWAAVWLPRVPSNWLRTSPPAAAELNRALAGIPGDAEVIGSQGVIGRLCGRPWCYTIAVDGPETFPLHGSATYVVVTPYDGIESASVGDELGILGDLAGPLRAALVSEQDNVWVFRLPAGRARTVRFDPTSTEPAWAARSATGTPRLSGPSSTWRLAQSTPAPGYALYGAEWLLAPGTYQATVTMASSAPVTVEVWDSTAGVLLSRQRLASVEAPRAVQSVVQVTQQQPSRPYSGWGPFSYLPRPGGTTDRIEIRVWTPGTGVVSLYNTEIRPYRHR